MMLLESDKPTTAGNEVTLSMDINGRCRVSYGNERGGRYVIVARDELQDYLLGRRPLAELVDRYFVNEALA